MSTPSNPGKAVAGWYPTSPGSTQLRWWDGDQWTEHFHTVASTDPASLRAPEGTSPYTAWIWIFALLPLVQLAELPFLIQLYDRILAAGVSDPTAISAAEFGPTSGYLALQAIGVLVYAICVLVSVFDFRALKSRGVPQPFHWAWTFLNSWVYAIGRAVVVRRRTGAGLAPMWVFILASVGVGVGVLIVVFGFVGEIIARSR